MVSVYPKTVGVYRLVEQLSLGEGSAVFRVLDGGGQAFVLKLHEPGQGEASGMAELQLLGLRHPGLACCLDAGRLPDDGRLYTVTEFVSGEPLAPGAVWENSPQPAVLALRLLTALGAVHDLGLLHRDLKAENILWDGQSGRPVIIDFGLSVPMGESSLSGTPRAMAPELFGGEAASRASDLWAVGLVLAEALGRQTLFCGENVEAMARERAAFARLPAAMAAQIGDDVVVALIEGLLDPSPLGRPSTAQLACAALTLAAGPERASLYRESLLGARSAAFARADARRDAQLRALQDGDGWLELFPRADDSLAQGLVRLVALAAGVLAPSDSLAMRRRAELAPRPQSFVALAEALGRLRSLRLSIGSCEAGEGPGRQLREQVGALLAPLPGITVVDVAGPEREEAVRVVNDWLGERPLLGERLGAVPPESWAQLDDCLDELVVTHVVTAGPEGFAWDETRLSLTWPLAETGLAPVFEPPLTDAQRDVLELLCLSPRGLSPADVSALLEWPVSASPLLDELLSAGYIRRSRSQPADLFAVASQRLAQSLGPTIRANSDLRTRLALQLLPDGVDPDEHLAGTLASLLLGASGALHNSTTSALVLRCAGSLRRAGREALAAELLHHGLEACNDLANRQSLHCELVDVLIRSARLDDAAAALGSARSDLGSSPRGDWREARLAALQGRLAEALPILKTIDLSALPRDEAVLALQLRGGVLHGLAQPQDALADLREALRLQGQQLSTRTMTLLERIGMLEFDLGAFDRAVQRFEQAVDMARKLGHDALLWSPTHNIGRVLREKGERRRGLAIQETAARLAEEAGNLFGVATVHNSMGAGWILLGRLDKARHHLDRALQVSRRIHDRVLEAMAQNNTGHALSMGG
ncbi:MAG: tetratricopeptide (TPR) repeat protein, partial [Pseudohongiellaceae bacterium]